jgi:(E)-4-hydroxy-3-methylbut-2-enyl-diphosphate synthase
MPAAPTSALAPYVPSRFGLARRISRAVRVGSVQVGGLVAGHPAPLVVQSMCTTPTQDVVATVRQCIVLAEAGCEVVRITAPGVQDARALATIRRDFSAAGFARIPLVADIHFMPAAALEAVEHVEKVRVNPGNYADKKRFAVTDYTDVAFAAEVERVAERFRPLVRRAKELGRCLRIGTNHGSLSDRIMNRYGDTPLGMVESALEFVRIAEAEGFQDLIISMKASNTKVMVQAYRLLVARLAGGGHDPYPLHLGVTEAGDGEDGRVKSAAGIAALLEDGLGDTIRVSLTEPPEAEIPVARALAARFDRRRDHAPPPRVPADPVDPYVFHRRTAEITRLAGIPLGGGLLPRVLVPASAAPGTPAADLLVDDRFLWAGAPRAVAGADRPRASIAPAAVAAGQVPLARVAPGERADQAPAGSVVLLRLDGDDPVAVIDAALAALPPGVLVGIAESGALGEVRAYRLLAAVDEARFTAAEAAAPGTGVRHPICIATPHLRDDLAAAGVAGALLIDGIGDALYLPSVPDPRRLSFTILQAVKARVTRADYVACPSCGRTQFDLMEVTAHIRAATGHLDGVTIAIMGCIVNGPGEMADADFGYVGSGPGKIDLYRGRDLVRRNLPQAIARDELIGLIREAGKWRDPS